MKSALYKQTLVELLYQLADDDFIVAYRGSEWLGVAPHIEEDVAFSSISQDKMGHAVIYYEMLEELGEGKADDLAHLREAKDRRNAIILEEVNGTGSYLKEPRYDWAFAVVRNYFYDLAKAIRLQSLKNSSYKPLAHTAQKMMAEQYYHLVHWRTWFTQLVSATDDSKRRMKEAIEKVWQDFGGVLTLGPKADEMEQLGLIEGEEALKEKWMDEISEVFTKHAVEIPNKAAPTMLKGDGRNKEFTADLTEAIKILSEVYSLDPTASW
ncbi:1,2-phenylacetyl-CoA epoxidase subunit PaaC [Oceanobacillus sp. CAU 1775]